MSDEDIVTKAIKKAIANGWQEPDDPYLADIIFAYGDWGDTERLGNQYEQYVGFMDARGLKDIIFNHGFARALWGETKDFVELGKTFETGVVTVAIDGWQYYLQQMVIAEDPVKYLGEHI